MTHFPRPRGGLGHPTDVAAARGDAGRVLERGASLRAASPTFVLVALAWLLVGCASPEEGAAVAPDRLFVADALGGTVVQLDAAGGRVAGPGIPAGASPWALAPDGHGGLLVLASPGRGGRGGHPPPTGRRRLGTGARCRRRPAPADCAWPATGSAPRS